jgi:ATP-dependent Clp protease ATP-binding subunit ClpX
LSAASGEARRLHTIVSLDALGVDYLARIMQASKGSLIAQFRKLVRFQGADLVFTDAAVKETARIALERGTGARGLRPVIEAMTLCPRSSKQGKRSE